MSRFLHWIMELSSQPFFSFSWKQQLLLVRGLNLPRYCIFSGFPWFWQCDQQEEMLSWEHAVWVSVAQGQQVHTCPDMVIVNGRESTDWKTSCEIQLNENYWVGSNGNQIPFSSPAGSGWLPVVPVPLSINPAVLLLNTKDILGPVVFPLYPQYLLENLSSAILPPVTHFRYSTWYWLELINISIVFFVTVELGIIRSAWQLVICSLKGWKVSSPVIEEVTVGCSAKVSW